MGERQNVTKSITFGPYIERWTGCLKRLPSSCDATAGGSTRVPSWSGHLLSFLSTSTAGRTDHRRTGCDRLASSGHQGSGVYDLLKYSLSSPSTFLGFAAETQACTKRLTPRASWLTFSLCVRLFAFLVCLFLGVAYTLYTHRTNAKNRAIALFRPDDPPIETGQSDPSTDRSELLGPDSKEWRGCDQPGDRKVCLIFFPLSAPYKRRSLPPVLLDVLVMSCESWRCSPQ